MRKHTSHSIILGFTLLLLSVQIAWAQVSPPDRSTVHTSNPVIRFSWPGQSSGNYFLQVYASGREMFRGDVKGTSATIPLPAGPKYQWKVSKHSGAGYTDVGEYTFQLSGNLTLDFNGADGTTGLSARDGSNQSYAVGSQEQMSGDDGGQGLDGGNGRDITVELQKAGDFIAVTVKGPTANQAFLLDPASAPILIQSTGGNGGSGGRGGDGAASYYLTPAGYYYQNNSGYYPSGSGRRANSNSNNYPATASIPAPYVYPAGNGGNGGAGGNGGNGGNVTIISNGVNGKRYVQVQNEGGLGGVGGGPGRGGPQVNASTLPIGATGYIGQAGSLGQQGLPGRDGRPGTVDYR